MSKVLLVFYEGSEDSNQEASNRRVFSRKLAEERFATALTQSVEQFDYWLEHAPKQGPVLAFILLKEKAEKWAEFIAKKSLPYRSASKWLTDPTGNSIALWTEPARLEILAALA